MCGIVGYFSKKKAVPIKTLIVEAYKNKHRGSEDGLGIIFLYKNKIHIRKTSLFLEELVSGKLNTYKRKDKTIKGVKDINAFFQEKLDNFQKILETKVKFCIVHHRKASQGSIKIANTHPFKIKKMVYYMQNGTQNHYLALRKYLMLNNDLKMKSYTDSEIVAYVAEEFLESWKYLEQDAFGNVCDYLSKIFSFFGVVIRADFEKLRVDFLTSGDRTFYIMELNKDKDVFFISEPAFPIEHKVHSCKQVYSGRVSLDLKEGELIYGDDCFFVDYTDKFKQLKEINNKSGVEIKSLQCDSCKVANKNVLRLQLMDSLNVSVTQDICPHCFITGRLRDNRDLHKDFKYDFTKKKEDDDYKTPLIEDVDNLDDGDDDIASFNKTFGKQYVDSLNENTIEKRLEDEGYSIPELCKECNFKTFVSCDAHCPYFSEKENFETRKKYEKIKIRDDLLTQEIKQHYDSRSSM